MSGVKSSRAFVYIVIGVDLDGCKDVLGIYIDEHETSKFWLTVLNELKN